MHQNVRHIIKLHLQLEKHFITAVLYEPEPPIDSISNIAVGYTFLTEDNPGVAQLMRLVQTDIQKTGNSLKSMPWNDGR